MYSLKSLLEAKNGAFLERTDYEMAHVFKNMMDPNTKATAKREITIKLTIQQNEDRSEFSVTGEVKSKLASTNPIRTSYYISGDRSTGEVQAVEAVSQIPGQFDIGGETQEEPAALKIVNLSDY